MSYEKQNLEDGIGDQGEQEPEGSAGVDGKDGADGLTTNINVNGQNYEHVNRAITLPNYPSRDGYTFTGWDKSFNNITSDLIVTAQYEKELEKNELLKLGENRIDSLYIGDQRIIQMYLNRQQLL